jgi:hypothetical protein
MLAVSFKPSVSEYDTAINSPLEMTKCASLQVYISVTCKAYRHPPPFLEWQMVIQMPDVFTSSMPCVWQRLPV